ncbi:MAG TPA: 50S ribosomal protein L11 methyltransferase [Candidatus Binatia bacterium]|nr:50S ribosomal protein L11 methyltransferase [Candidatus Binatia bacterium]
MPRHSSRPWLRLRLRVPEEIADELGVVCIELGAPGVVTGERDLRRARPAGASGTAAKAARWTRFEAYFPPGRDVRRLAQALASALATLAVDHPALARRAIRLEKLALPDYGPAVRSHFPALAIGRRLFVCPPWTPEAERRKAAAAGRIPLVIVPGQAFGTGHHATTRGCLVAIERACGGAPPARALDVGSGSGILAIALRKLGAREVVAVDVDPVARRATASAARANRASGVRVAASLAAARGRFDVVVANLFADLLVDLAPRLAAHVRPGGRLVVAGLLASQERAVADAFARVGFAPARRQARATWVVLELARRPATRAAASPVRRAAPGGARALP